MTPGTSSLDLANVAARRMWPTITAEGDADDWLSAEE